MYARKRSSKLSIQEPIDCMRVYVLGPAPGIIQDPGGFEPETNGDISRRFIFSLELGLLRKVHVWRRTMMARKAVKCPQCCSQRVWKDGIRWTFWASAAISLPRLLLSVFVLGTLCIRQLLFSSSYNHFFFLFRSSFEEPRAIRNAYIYEEVLI